MHAHQRPIRAGLEKILHTDQRPIRAGFWSIHCEAGHVDIFDQLEHVQQPLI